MWQKDKESNINNKILSRKWNTLNDESREGGWKGVR